MFSLTQNFRSYCKFKTQGQDLSGVDFGLDLYSDHAGGDGSFQSW